MAHSTDRCAGEILREMEDNDGKNAAAGVDNTHVRTRRWTFGGGRRDQRRDRCAPPRLHEALSSRHEVNNVKTVTTL
jgi:hypothetical protein